MTEQGELEDVDCLRHPPGMVVCARTGDQKGPSFLPLNTAPKEELRKFKELLVVTAGKKVCILRKKSVINEG